MKHRLFNRAFAALLSVMLVIGLMPVTALAAGEHDSHSNNWTELTADTTLSGGSYYLSKDVEYSGTESITVSGEVTLCLNGHKLDLNKPEQAAYFRGQRRKSYPVRLLHRRCSHRRFWQQRRRGVCGRRRHLYNDRRQHCRQHRQRRRRGVCGRRLNKGSFTLSGGSITGNTTNSDTFGYGGGVCLYGIFYLSGDAIIQDNTKAGTTDNLYLGWNTIEITGPLGENAHIGVTAEGIPRSFINGWSDYMAGKDPADHFSTDGDALGIGLNANGDVVLGGLCTTITLNLNGGILPEYSLVEGAALPIPTRTGYTFAGWYENPEFSGDPVTDVPTDSTENLNFYAKWTDNTYTVIFDANGGSVNPTSAVAVAGKLTSLPTPTYDGYDFIGWYTQKDGGDKVTTDTVFTVDSTIYAHWQNIPVTNLELNKDSLTLQEKSSDTLTATVKPNNATNKDVTWESSNTNIATVNEDGIVTAISAGTATITATAQDGSGVSISCSVIVTHSNMIHTPKKDATCTEQSNTEYWTCESCKKHFSDAEGKNEISPAQTVIDAKGHSYKDGKCTVCGTIDSDFKAVILSGANGTWQKGSKDGLSFTSSAAYAHFQKVQVDGKDLDASNYTVKEGSTIVTLKASYLETLSVGKHTISIVSETGTVDTNFTIKSAPATSDEDVKSPQTGDNNNMSLWIALLFVSGAGLLGAVAYNRKRKYSR